MISLDRECFYGLATSKQLQFLRRNGCPGHLTFLRGDDTGKFTQLFVDLLGEIELLSASMIMLPPQGGHRLSENLPKTKTFTCRKHGLRHAHQRVCRRHGAALRNVRATCRNMTQQIQPEELFKA